MAIKANLRVDQGTDFAVDIQLTDSQKNKYNLTGHTVASQMRKSYSAASFTAFTTSIVNPATNGVIKLELNNTTTNGLAPGRYVYDIEITDSAGKVSRVVEGMVEVRPGVTRS